MRSRIETHPNTVKTNAFLALIAEAKTNNIKLPESSEEVSETVNETQESTMDILTQEKYGMKGTD
ncbi:hypothetical protein K9M59_00805 [Candidatus Gracilibacteria bacterium]|nr:hypothetical protein [Candidatus Gracilibacteria bacterium]MCF7819117.1 hypothetical protein [Candidatus Gracilibacteria bacterium]